MTNWVCRFGAGALMMMGFSGLALAATISGTVTNRTTNKPSAGDEVVLIRLAQGMQELSRTKTDAKGNFKLEVPDEALHLVRVTHDKANYFRPAPAGTESVEIDVFNASAKVKGITSEANVLRLQTDESGKSLRVTENFFVKNDSNPPMTQFSDRPFEFYLPAGAVVEGSAALSPGGMPVQASPVPLGDPNHFAFVFPVRPGETRFQITYKLPYSGSMKFAPRPVMTTDTIAVMMPKSMEFEADAAAGFAAVTEDTTAQTYVLRNVESSAAVAFTVSGIGQLPRDSQAGAGGSDAQGGGGAEGGAAAGAGATSAAADTRPGGGLGTPLDPEGANDPWAKYKWWIIGGLGLLLAGGAGVMLKGGGTAVPVAAAPVGLPVATGGAGLLGALKEELFALETDRLQGRLSEAEFAEQKAALEVVLRRALARGDGSSEGV